MLSEAGRLFQVGDDQKALKSAIADEQRLVSGWAAEEADAKDAIRALTENLDVAKTASAKVKSNDAHDEALEKLEKVRFSVAKECNGLEQSFGEKELEMQRLEREILELESQVETAKETTTVDMPKIQYAFSLYGMISKIQWLHADAANDSAKQPKVAGTYETANKSLHTFSLDPSRQTREFIVDYLWEQVSPAC